MSWCLVAATAITIVCTLPIFVQGIEFGILTQPSDLGFEKYVEPSSETRSIFFIQPTKSGFIEANIGGVESRHDYNMSSISVFLSDHLVTMQGNYISDLFTLCSVENAHLVAKSNAVLLCHFDVSMPSYDGYIFSSSSCLIHCAKETECAAKIDLDFLRRQAQISVPNKSELTISYNVTALDVNSLSSQSAIIERDDVTNSLIYKHMKLPSVYVQRRPDTEFLTLLTNKNGYPSIQLEAPRISDAKYFDLVILQTSSTSVWKMKLKFVFSSQLRFLWAKEKEGGVWKLQGTPSPRGLTVKLRQRSLPQLHSPSASTLDDVNDSIQANTLEESILIRRTATQIGLLRFERVMKNSNRPSQSVVESFTHLPTSLPHISDVDDDPEIEDTEELNVIKVRVTGIDWPKGMANASRLPGATGRLVRLPIPETLPDPNSMHIFVQFQEFLMPQMQRLDSFAKSSQRPCDMEGSELLAHKETERPLQLNLCLDLSAHREKPSKQYKIMSFSNVGCMASLGKTEAELGNSRTPSLDLFPSLKLVTS
ncbi:hypothetical protein ECG_02551 [Echinococcus granulosus]|nr:hypothetical protein ECG_02551 [Echinococcus granulosus]